MSKQSEKPRRQRNARSDADVQSIEQNIKRTYLDEVAEAHGKQLLDAHQRVRTAARRTGIRHAVEPQLPPDVLGMYVYLPMP